VPDDPDATDYNQLAVLGEMAAVMMWGQVNLSPEHMDRLRAAGWRPGILSLEEWLVSRAELYAAVHTCASCRTATADRQRGH